MDPQRGQSNYRGKNAGKKKNTAVNFGKNVFAIGLLSVLRITAQWSGNRPTTLACQNYTIRLPVDAKRSSKTEHGLLVDIIHPYRRRCMLLTGFMSRVFVAGRHSADWMPFVQARQCPVCYLNYAPDRPEPSPSRHLWHMWRPGGGQTTIRSGDNPAGPVRVTSPRGPRRHGTTLRDRFRFDRVRFSSQGCRNVRSCRTGVARLIRQRSTETYSPFDFYKKKKCF